VRGIGFGPTIVASVSLGVTGLMKAAFGVRALFFFGAAALFTGLAAAFFAGLAATFFFAAFFFAAVFAMRSPLKTLYASRESTTK